MWFCYYKDTRTFKEAESRREGDIEMDRGSGTLTVHDFKQYAKLIKAIFWDQRGRSETSMWTSLENGMEDQQ